ncbi:hypothetical protein PWT90_09645 [Aphanocladium album]|nr:hypothetical protein PWT90_09645 [Aphanocladium album]
MPAGGPFYPAIPDVNEKTFRFYSKEQCETYAKTRREFSPRLYQAILDRHTSTGGMLDFLLDVGCGPGSAARSLAPSFLQAIGIDPSAGMIATARSLGGVTQTAERIRFDISTAEDLGCDLSPSVADSSVDLITAANAAHWFDMPRFWAAALRVLKPGGSVALWTSSYDRAHASTPNALAIQSAMDEYIESNLQPYFMPGNHLERNRYVDLPLPWTLPQPLRAFDSSTLFRKEWEAEDEDFMKAIDVDLDTLEQAISSESSLVRWYQAHPGAAGTDRDIVKILRRNIERLLHDAGVEKGKETLRLGVQGTLIIVKKRLQE